MSRVPIHELSCFELDIRPIAGGNWKNSGWEFIGDGLLLISGLNNQEEQDRICFWLIEEKPV